MLKGNKRTDRAFSAVMEIKEKNKNKNKNKNKIK